MGNAPDDGETAEAGPTRRQADEETALGEAATVTTEYARARASAVILAPGATVGRYRLEARCGQGGFATVYRALDPEGNAVALKVLHPMLGGSLEVLHRFEQEARILNRLESPHIVRVFEVGEVQPGRPFFAMEWLSGWTLESMRQARGQLSLAEALAVLRGLCAALARAHGEAIVHRDIKGENVMVPEDADLDRIKLVDFGIAKLLEKEDAPGVTRTGSRLGTPGYMAPEQIMGLRVDARADIYALGVLLFELVTGTMPFTGRRGSDIEEKALRLPVPRASERAAVPRALDDVIARCMAKFAEDRFASAEELAGALAALAGSPARDAAIGAGDGSEAGREPASAEKEMMAAGLYVAVLLPHSLSDDALDAADAEIEAIAADAARAGLERAAGGSSWCLFVRPLPIDPAARARECEGVRAFARACLDALPPELRARLRFALHAAPATRTSVADASRADLAVPRLREGAAEGGGARYRGPLLVIGGWAAGAAEPGLVETAAFSAGLAGGLSD